MNPLTAIIIDDESHCRSALFDKLTLHCPEVVVIAECENGEEGIVQIEEKKPDIVFLDVEMPRINGFTMLQQLRNRDFELIFTTAYGHYAVRAIRVSAIDYLVKPIEPADLKEAVHKAVATRQTAIHNKRLELLVQNTGESKKERQRLAVPSMDGMLFLQMADIVCLEAQSNYTVIFLLDGKKITVPKTLKDFEEILPDSVFVRIHHAYIINCNAVDKYIKGEGGQVLMSNQMTLDVSKRKKADFLKAMNG